MANTTGGIAASEYAVPLYNRKQDGKQEGGEQFLKTNDVNVDVSRTHHSQSLPTNRYPASLGSHRRWRQAASTHLESYRFRRVGQHSPPVQVKQILRVFSRHDESSRIGLDLGEIEQSAKGAHRRGGRLYMHLGIPNTS